MALVKLQAHKGVEIEYPENTMVSFEAAVEQKYEMIELDLRVTKDGQIVTMHDKYINNTARKPDGSELEEKILCSDLTYSELCEYDFGIKFSDEFKGVKPPLFRDVLKLAKDNGILLKIDNKIKEMTPEQRVCLYEMIKESGADVCISLWNLDAAKEVKEMLPDAEASFDGLSDETKLIELEKMFGKDKFTIWLPVDRCMAKWAPEEWFITSEKVEVIKKHAKLAIWAIKDVESFRNACILYHPYAAETKGNIKPADRAGL